MRSSALNSALGRKVALRGTVGLDEMADIRHTDLDGVEMPVSGKLVDCGEPQGKKTLEHDLFEIFAGGNLFVRDQLGGGNIQLHPPNPSLD
jgi:hypothetical protein